MPTPVVRQRLQGSDPNGATITLTTASGTQVGDLLVCFHGTSSNAVTGMVTPTGTAGTWTLRATGDQGTNSAHIKVWTRMVTAAGAQTVSCPGNSTAGNYQFLYVLTGEHDVSPFDGAAGSSGASTTTMLAPSISPVGENDLLLNAYLTAGGSVTDHTAAAGTQLAEDVELDASFSTMSVWRQNLTVAGATGTTSRTVTAAAARPYASVSIAIRGLDDSTPIDPGGDSGAGDDTVTVDKTDWKNLTDSGATTEALDVLLDWPVLAETGTGDDVVAVDIVVDVGTLTDSGLSTETLEVANFKGNDLTDSGLGDDLIDLVQTTFVDLADSGDGDDVISQEVQWPLTDSGTGVETMVGLGTPIVTDSGVGSELITVVDIPFTQVLPPSRMGNLYDLVVVARVVQQSGPPSFIEIDPIEWTDLTLTEELLNGQDLQASCQISSLSPTIIAAFQDLGSQPVELWLYRNGRLIFAGPLRNGNSDNMRLSLTAKGAADYLRQMFVRSDLVFKNEDQATIVKKMVDQHQATDFGHYGINTGSINPTGILREITYLKTELQNVAQKVQDLAKSADGFDFEVDPESRNLEIWFPGKGVDKSSGEDAVVFDSRNITSSSMAFSCGPDDIATEAFGTGTAVSGDGTSYGAVTNSELLARYGRSTIAGTWDGVPDQNTLNGLLQGLLNVRVTQLVVPGPDARDTPDSTITAYGVGDTVLYQPNELLTVASAYRIRKRSVKVTSAGQESVSLEFT